MNFSSWKNTFFYLLVAVCFCQITAMAQNDPISLECVNTNLTTGTSIQWTMPTTCDPADFDSYNIYVAQDINNFVLQLQNTDINITSTTLDEDTNPVFLDETVTQYVYATYTCNGVESIPSDTISNQSLPAIELTRVNVAAGFVNIEWTPLDNSNVGGYVIAIPNGQSVQTLDTIFDPSAGFYTDYTIDTQASSASYAVFAIDKCENDGVSNTNYHTTINFQSTLGSCSSILNFGWNHYEGWDNLNDYIVYQSDIPNLPGTPIDTIAATENTYEYLLGVASNDMYFQVEAVGEHQGNIVRSFSNQFAVPAFIPSLPAEMQLYYASVVSGLNDVIYLEFETSPASSSIEYKLHRGVNSQNEMVESDLLGITPFVQFEDAEASTDPNKYSYYYKIVAKDECGVTKETNYTRTILLTHQDNFDQTITLNWNEFELEGATVSHYELVRYDSESSDDRTVLASFAPGDAMTFVDDVSAVSTIYEQFYQYQVIAYYSIDTNTYGTIDTESYSNKREVTKNSQILDMPTAFRPNGVNSIFKPAIDFPNEDAYSMIIMNRWGEKVFESTDPEIGWDGMVNGILATQGVYAYIIRMESFNTRELIRKGTVLLVR